MDTLDVLTEIAQKHRFTLHLPNDDAPLGSPFHISFPPRDGRSFVKFRKEKTRRTRGVRAVNDGRSRLGVIEINVWYNGSDIWFNRTKKISLCEPDSLSRLTRYFKKAK